MDDKQNSSELFCWMQSTFYLPETLVSPDCSAVLLLHLYLFYDWDSWLDDWPSTVMIISDLQYVANILAKTEFYRPKW